MKIIKTILQVLLIAQFSFFGVSKIIGATDMVATFTAFGFPSWFMVFTGVVEIVAVLALLYGFVNSGALRVGAFLVAGLTVCAAVCHFVLEGSVPNGIIPLVVFAQNGLMVWLAGKIGVVSSSVALA